MIPLWPKFYATNPLADVVPDRDDLSGWNSDSPVFAQVIAETRPRVIVEVGSWKGASAVHMAKLCNAGIVCVDTWLGSSEMWEFADLQREHGYPSVYRTFASNVVRHVGREQICPIPLPSPTAAGLLKARGVHPELVYIDGSHDYRDVVVDLRLYWELLLPGGILFGDDAGHSGVAAAVDQVLPGVQVVGEKYIARKPLG